MLIINMIMLHNKYINNINITHYVHVFLFKIKYLNKATLATGINL